MYPPTQNILIIFIGWHRVLSPLPSFGLPHVKFNIVAPIINRELCDMAVQPKLLCQPRAIIYFASFNCTNHADKVITREVYNYPKLEDCIFKSMQFLLAGGHLITTEFMD